MHVLILDAIHGGTVLAQAFAAEGHAVDLVDVYRGAGPVSAETARTRNYDLVVAPVHLDPDHPLLKEPGGPVISHHEAVRRLLGTPPHPMIEITGARGKTTTAHALAFLMQGPGVLHTSSGTFRFPGKAFMEQTSITPASVLGAARHAGEAGGWLVAEESLGVSGAGDLAIITSAEDYRCAAGKKSALGCKTASARMCRQVLVAEDMAIGSPAMVVRLGELSSVNGTTCTIRRGGKTWQFENPLLALPGYCVPLQLAASAAVLLGLDPSPLALFPALPGRMSVSEEGPVTIVDNANSGTGLAAALEAARYARDRAPSGDLTLVIGQPPADGAVCEGFGVGLMAEAIRQIDPAKVIWVGDLPPKGSPEYATVVPRISARAGTLDLGRRMALDLTARGTVVLAVRTWR